jgi:5-methylcytosine-specific restriction endonuclease McrA
MKEHLNQIRKLLDDLEVQADPGFAQASERDFSAAELPLIIQEIVDDLQPLLTPYEVAFYWYLFRHSIGRTGNQHVRVSVRELQKRVAKSFRTNSGAGEVAFSTVSSTMIALERIGAIRKEGEPNRNGTPYRLLIPDEIESCRKFRAERTAAEARTEVAAADLDYYNLRENRVKVYERDEYKCRYCGKQLTRFTATLDHVRPVAEGGDNGFENLVTACLGCNSRKHKRTVGDFLADQ